MLSYGVGWVVSLLLLRRLAWRAIGDQVLLAPAAREPRRWMVGSVASNRLYGPLASRLIERRDYSGMLSTIKERHSWIVPATLVYFGVMVLFGRRILRLFGAEFESGYPALCLVAAGASFSVWFAMAPSYLKFVGRNGQVLGNTTAAGLLNVTRLVALGPRWGATGADSIR